MSSSGRSPIYRIERHAPHALHLYRDDELVDVDRDDPGDSRADIERWGTAVAWAEDYTAVQRWDPPGVDEGWQTLIAVPYRYVTWLDGDDLTVWNEVDSTGLVTRHIGARTRDQAYTAAASLAEVIAAQDSGGIDAVRTYEEAYGVVPETPSRRDAEAVLAP